MREKFTPIHKWTDGGDRVLIVKCVEKGGVGYGGFQWPKSGKVQPANCSTKPDCDSGGLFGWAWGLNISAQIAPKPKTPPMKTAEQPTGTRAALIED